MLSEALLTEMEFSHYAALAVVAVLGDFDTVLSGMDVSHSDFLTQSESEYVQYAERDRIPTADDFYYSIDEFGGYIDFHLEKGNATLERLRSNPELTNQDLETLNYLKEKLRTAASEAHNALNEFKDKVEQQASDSLTSAESQALLAEYLKIKSHHAREMGHVVNPIYQLDESKGPLHRATIETT